MTTVDVGHIVIEPGVLSGEPHISGHRIAVSDVAVWTNYHGMSPGEIAEEFHLTLGEIYAALSYYYDHKEEIDHDIAEANRLHDEMARRYPNGWHPGIDMSE